MNHSRLSSFRFVRRRNEHGSDEKRLFYKHNVSSLPQSPSSSGIRCT